MKPRVIASALQGTSLFSELAPQVIQDIAEHAQTRRYERNEYIFHLGDEGDSLFVVAEGLVKIYVTSEAGDEVVLATLKPLENFGGIAVIDEGARTASAKTIEPTTLIVFHREQFRDLLQQHPPLLDALHRSLGTLLRRSLEQTSDLVFLDLPGRVAKLLVNLSNEMGESKTEGILLDLKVTQQTLAGMVGGSRPSVNQILRSFEAKGYLTLDGRKVLIRDLARLKERGTP